MKSTLFQIELAIHATPSFVWTCLVEQTSMWWDRRFFTTSLTKKMEIEEFVGGHIYEDFGKREGVLWGEVVVVHAPNLLEFKGHLRPNFGGPALSYSTLRLLSSEEEVTTILFDETWMGLTDTTSIDTMKLRWSNIFRALKTYAEEHYLGS